MKVVYVAGPYRGETESDVVRNIRAAEAVAIRIWKMGHAAICPHKNTALFGGLCPDDVWLKGDLEILSRCDELILCVGWEKSKGTADEIQLAKSLGIPVFYTLEAWEKARGCSG